MLELIFITFIGGVAITTGGTIALLSQALKFDRWSKNQTAIWTAGAMACFLLGAAGTCYLIIKIAMSS